MGLPPEGTSCRPRPGLDRPRWSIVLPTDARQQEDRSGAQFHQPLDYQRMEMAFWCSARPQRACSLAAPRGSPNSAKGEAATNRDQCMEKRRQTKAPNGNQEHLGSPLETSGAPHYQCQGFRAASHHYQRLVCRHHGRVWRRTAKLGKSSKPSTRYTNKLARGCTNNGRRQRPIQARKIHTMDFRARITIIGKCRASDKTRKVDKHCTIGCNL